MSPRKLTEADKSEILKLYRQLEETTSTLALRYGVSNSTISRLLKSSLQESEYELLIQQKRANRTPGGAASLMLEERESYDTPIESDEAESSPILPTPQPEVEVEMGDEEQTFGDLRRRRRRSSVATEPNNQQGIQTELPLGITPSIPENNFAQLVPVPIAQENDFDQLSERFETISSPQNSDLEDLLNEEDLMDLDLDLEEEEDDDDDLEEDWDDDGLDVDNQVRIKTNRIQGGAKVQVLPLSEASLPKTCYLVVDRAAELIARPLKEFGDLGRIPAEEVLEKTLPIFDNHRVARRFSNRSQRVIKVPDSRMLQKTRSHLQAKGITRLLIDGQVYSLLPLGPSI
jgi:transposase-like protein